MEDIFDLFPSVPRNEIERIYNFVDHKLQDPYSCYKNTSFYDDNVLVIGERVIQKDLGIGTVDDVEYCSDKIVRFKVVFDSGKEVCFKYPVPFLSKTMEFESGPKKVDEKQAMEQFKKYEAYSYKSWTNYYPNAIVIKKEGYFWTCRGESAEKIHEILGFKLGYDGSGAITGCPNLNRMVAALKKRKINYVVIENGVTKEKGVFGDKNAQDDQADSKRFFLREK